MVDTDVPLEAKLGEVAKKHEILVDAVRQLIMALKAENAELKERLAKYEPVNGKTDGGKHEYEQLVYVVGDRQPDGTISDCLVVPSNREKTQSGVFADYKNRVLVTPSDPIIVAGGNLFTVRGQVYFSEEFHSDDFGYGTVSAAIDAAVQSAKTKIEQGIAL